MIKHKVKVDRKKTKHDAILRNSFVNYIRYSTPKELTFDLFIPFITAILLTLIVAYIIPTPRDFIKIIQDLNSIVITITAILAGFNTASLAIIASTNKLDGLPVNKDNEITAKVPKVELSIVNKFKNWIVNTPSKSESAAIVSFFSYAVISQLLILVISIIINVLLTSILKIEAVFPMLESNVKFILIIPLSSIWIFMILHAIFLSIRNIDLIAHFIKYKP